MRKFEMKICKDCKTLYRCDYGGIVMGPQDHIDMGYCEKCRTKYKNKGLGGIFKKSDKK